MGMADFFSMEASDYLERLDGLVSPPRAPDPSDFLRLSRALRGSALMANQHQISSVAGGLEGLARSVAEQQTPWDEATRQLAIRAVDDLKVLVRAVHSWTDAEDARARQINAELERYTGRATSARRVLDTGIDTGTRAFIAREGAAVASALDHTYRTVAGGHDPAESFDAVLRAMQPLRGIASLSDLPPMPDLLEGIERAVQEINRSRRAAPAELFDAAARAVSDVAQQIATGGSPAGDSPEADRFARLLAALMDLETDVVPIEAMYYNDDGPHVVETGSGGTPPPQLGRLELVSHLEHLTQAADGIESAATDAQRVIRANGLAPTLRALATAAGGPLASAAAAFARATRDAVMRGVATSEPAAFAARLREASRTLSEAAQSTHAPPNTRLSQVIDAIGQLAQPAAPAPPPAPGTPEPAVAPAPAAPEPVSIESLAPDAPTPAPPAPAPPPAPPVPAGPGPTLAETDLAAAFAIQETLEERLGIGEGSLEELVAGPPDLEFLRTGDEPARPVAPTVAPPEPTAAVIEPPQAEPVPITELLYSPDDAFRRAEVLRVEVRSAVTRGDSETADALLDEIFDLVQIGNSHR